MSVGSKALAAGGAAVALAAGGVAMADASGGGGQGSTAANAKHARRTLAGARLGRLTHADLHLFAGGRARDVRLDRGVLRSVSGSAVVLHELDGSDVTVPVDSSTRVRRMGAPAKLADLRVGDVALTVRPAGGPARIVRSPGHPPRRR